MALINRHLPRTAAIWLPPHPARIWASSGIRTRLLVPLVLLVLISLTGSTIGFLISTDTTRGRILDGQLAEDARRVADTWRRRERDVVEGAHLLAADGELARALLRDSLDPGGGDVLNLDRRVLPIRDRFRLDQVLLLNSDGQVRVNMAARSALSQIDVAAHVRGADRADARQPVLVQAGDAWLLVGYAVVYDRRKTAPQGSPIGEIYSVLDVSDEVGRIRRDLGMASDIQLAADTVIVSTIPALAAAVIERGQHDIRLPGRSYRSYMVDLALGQRGLSMALLRDDEAISAVVQAGFQAMLVSSGITLLLLLIVGTLIARALTRPILGLAEVARAVAAGDLARRAGLTGEDEIGQLGKAFDHATATIERLLDRQTQVAGEMQAILHSIADGVLAIDPQERILLVNPCAAALLGQPPEALLGQPLGTLLLAEDTALLIGLQHVVEQLQSELTDPDMAITEQRIALGSLTIKLRSAPIIDDGQACRGAVVVLQDITREVAAERAKSDFITIASHELRTPLTVVKGHVDMLALLGKHNLTSDQCEALAAVRRQTDNLVQLLNDLLEMARAEQGGIVPERAWVPLGAQVEEVMGELERQVLQRRISMTLRLVPDLPPLWVDPLHLRRILLNLISNAVKYVYDGGWVEVRAYELDDPHRLEGMLGDQPWPHPSQRSLVIEVEDNGVGIRAEDQEHIFVRFFRSHNARSVAAGGTGLGLTITRTLVHLHGGQIGFRSIEGVGSCFWVRLPLYTVEPIQVAVPADLLTKES